MSNKLTVIVPVYNQEELVKRALESIPSQCNIIVVDDGSTDGTMHSLLEFQNTRPNVEVLYNTKNKGVSVAINKALDFVKDGYVVLLGSDDYFYTDNLEILMKEMDGTDLIYFDLQVDNGDIWKLDNDSKYDLCGSVKLIRREFIGKTRNNKKLRHGEDLKFFIDLQAKKPTEKFTNICAKHYTFPREGSLTNLSNKE